MSAGALAALRAPFPPEKVQHRPEVNCRACLAGSCVEHEVVVCEVCHQTVSTAHTHISFVGHANLTARLLEVDPFWSWEPLALDADGLPKLDAFGGLWIRLTIHDRVEMDGFISDQAMRRLGYGDAGPNRNTPNGVKEAIGDALRNAAMRFGAALELWGGDRDRTMVDGRPGLPAGGVDADARAPLWEAIRVMSARAGRVENRAVAAHFDDSRSAGDEPIGHASAMALASYILQLVEEASE